MAGRLGGDRDSGPPRQHASSRRDAACASCLGGQGRRGGETATARIVAPEAAGTIPDRVGAVEMAADEHPQARAGAPAGLLGELEAEALEGDGVIEGDGALLLVAEDGREIDAAQ